MLSTKLAWKFVFLIYLCLSLECFAKDEVILKDIASNETRVFSHEVKEGEVFFFISAHCPMCRSQLKEIDCFESYGKVSIIALAGSDRDLKREKYRLNVRKPFFRANDKLIDLMGLKSLVTPQIVMIGKKKSLKLVGYHACSSSEITEFLVDKSLKL